MSAKELNIGDYVRTKKGEIYHVEHDEILKFLSNSNYHKIIKSSPNIIDLIEVGDYVNEHRVISINKEQNKIMEIYLDTKDYFEEVIYKNEDIKSIVTKEQFESIEYKC